MTASPGKLAALLAAWREGDLSAARLLDAATVGIPAEPADWAAFLETTRHPDFLTALPDETARLAWSALCFEVIERTDFDLGDLFRQRAAAIPDHVLFRELSEGGGEAWSYARIARRLRETAAVLLRESEHHAGPPAGPRVALLCANGLGGACADLACLTHGIFDCPLDIHAGVDNLVWIFERVGFTAAVCDHPDRLDKLLAVRERLGNNFRIFTLNLCLRVGRDNIVEMDERRASLSAGDIDATLAGRPRPGLREPATVMFTSGSTGRPKGVVFSQLNLVSKRFARAAALPAVGRDEVLLCYLPLYHTFGRFLEMLGTIFWGGTYVFAGNPSADTLLAQLQEIRPTALVSVPVRWVQIRDRVVASQDAALPEEADRVFREVVGDRLAWGLSAAGWLDPRVFRFFHGHGVTLCSGFGMTEGTGGLTMTPPGDYVEESVGVPLPGVKVRFGERDELQIAGIYVARYLPEDGTPGDLTVAEPDSDDHWLATGDLFRKVKGEHLEIVDRVKDIYKNNRGQTIAPRKVESLFTNVPGIERTFLAGDGRAYNTLLIVPDDRDAVLASLPDAQARRDYFQQIVTTANPQLAPYERVLNFTVLERDFSIEQGELTPKGSLRRKTIERNFADVIAELYQTSVAELRLGTWRIRIPHWIPRDLGVLDDAIETDVDGLVNRETGARLVIGPAAEGRIRIGDLEYDLTGDVVDLGLVARQPLLWVANPQFESFAPCRTGWDLACTPFAERVTRPLNVSPDMATIPPPAGQDPDLTEVDHLCRKALYGVRDDALAAIVELDQRIEHVGTRLGRVIRRRLEALARHPDQTVRCRAYQVLVLDQPVPEYEQFLPAFVDSGLPFLDEESFETISRAAIEPRRLQALRQRLHSYRTQLTWPAGERTQRVFRDLFRLLANFARAHPDFYNPVREELVSWAMHDQDPALATAAETHFDNLATWYEQRLLESGDDADPAAWLSRIVFQEGLGEAEVVRLEEVLVGTTFLRESVMLAFEGEELDLTEIGPGGIWVSRIISRYEDSRYRVSINTAGGKHFDLQVIIRQDVDRDLVRETIYWYIVLQGYPFGTPMLPKFGCCRPELGALSLAYVSDLTVWEKIREYSSVRGPGVTPPTRMRWHQLLVRAITVVVKGWRNSGKRIIPGLITPNNIVVPEPDFRHGAVQNNLTGWRQYTGPLSLIRPIWRNIYRQTLSHYPWTREYLERGWIFESIVEALGVDDGLAWLQELRAEIGATGGTDLGLGFEEVLDRFIDSLEHSYYQPLALKSAINRFFTWERVNNKAPLKARLNVMAELTHIYRLDRLPEIARFTLFRHTYFNPAGPDLLDIFDRLLMRMFRHPERPATRMVELSDLQAALVDPDDRVAFNRLAFPDRSAKETVEVRTVGDPERDRVVVRTTLTDRLGIAFNVGEAATPADVGCLYRIFLRAGHPTSIGAADRHFVVTDRTEQIVGGVIYRDQDPDTVFLDGIVVARTLEARGISEAVLEDFCTRMRAQGIRHIKTHFFLRRFYERQGFRVDPRSGAMVRFL